MTTGKVRIWRFDSAAGCQNQGDDMSGVKLQSQLQREYLAGWVSVHVSLPHAGIKVSMRTNYGDFEGVWMGGQWVTVDGTYNLPVTHWRPISNAWRN